MTEVLLSQLAHVEVISPNPQASVDWYTKVLGLEESARERQSIYLRAWGDEFHHSLVVTEGRAAGLGHVGWRTRGPQDVEAIARRMGENGHGVGYEEGNVGHGASFRYTGPGGHVGEVFWEVELYDAPAELVTDFPGRPQKYTGRGVAARYLDHVTIATPDVVAEAEWQRDNLGLKWTDMIRLRNHPHFGDWVVFSTLTTHHTHELGIVPDPGRRADGPARINHVAFWVDQRTDVERAANVLLDAGTVIEFGPGIHGIDEITYLYVREPSGLRVEINSGGRRLFQPDWKTPEWTPEQGATSFYRNLGMPDSMVESFPVVASGEGLDVDAYTPGATA